MTREEAIKSLKVLRKDFSGYKPNEEIFDMAIKALEQEPCVAMRDLSDEEIKHFAEEMKKVRLQTMAQEPCEDAISRQVVNELFDSEIKMYEERIETRKGSNYHDETERIKEFRSRIANAEYWQNKIKALPPVTPTRKKGKWIRVDHNKVKCSKCEITHLIAQYPHGAIDFCPNCGAEMESEE